MSVARNKSTFASWLELLRVPNLLTVPGDPVAGYLLAMQADASLRFSILAVAAASVCFYAAGLLLNDLHDLEIDRCQRPERPLPSSRIAVPEAVIALAILLGAGIGLCATAGLRALLAGLLLVTAIVTYNLFLKNVPLVGALGMGLCRGLSLLLGWAAYRFFTPVSLRIAIAACTLTLYVAAVTVIARHETEKSKYNWRFILPAAVVGAGLVFFRHIAQSPPLMTELAQLVLLVVIVLKTVSAPARTILAGARTPQLVGSMLRTLIPLQAFFILGSQNGAAAWLGGVVVLALWPIASILSRRFYMS